MNRIDMICSPDDLISGVKKEKIYCFLVGPIMNSSEWQFTVPSIDNVVWVNPRRPIKIDGNLPKDEWDKQVDWETMGLRVSDYVICWIPSPENIDCKDYAKTTRSEVLEVLSRRKNVIIGISDDFPGKNYLKYKANQYGISVVHNDLSSCIDELKLRISEKKFSNYFTSDTHFSQVRTLELSKRPFIDTDDMDWTIIERWNKVVSPFDTVFHLGDFGDWSKLKYLNGNIVLILGNYERKEMKDKNMDYIDYHDWLIGLGFKNIFLNYSSCNLYSEDLGFDEEVGLVHEPSIYCNLNDNLKSSINYCCFGHTHGRQMIKGFGLDVGVDCHNFSPISEKDVIFYLNAIKKGYYDNEVFIN